MGERVYPEDYAILRGEKDVLRWKLEDLATEHQRVTDDIAEVHAALTAAGVPMTQPISPHAGELHSAAGRVQHLLSELADLRARLERAESAAEGLLSKDDENAIHRMHREKCAAEARRAVQEEREACAKVAEEIGRRWLGRGSAAFAEVAAGIRSRGGA